MVRPVVYVPTKAFKLSDAEKDRYKKIAQDIKTNTAGAQKSATSIADALTTTASYDNTAWDPSKDDAIEANEISDITGGVADVDTSDVFFEESGLVAKEDEEVDVDERSLWGDGEKNPADGDDA